MPGGENSFASAQLDSSRRAKHKITVTAVEVFLWDQIRR